MILGMDAIQSQAIRHNPVITAPQKPLGVVVSPFAPAAMSGSLGGIPTTMPVTAGTAQGVAVDDRRLPKKMNERMQLLSNLLSDLVQGKSLAEAEALLSDPQALQTFFNQKTRQDYAALDARTAKRQPEIDKAEAAAQAARAKADAIYEKLDFTYLELAVTADQVSTLRETIATLEAKKEKEKLSGEEIQELEESKTDLPMAEESHKLLMEQLRKKGIDPKTIAEKMAEAPKLLEALGEMSDEASVQMEALSILRESDLEKRLSQQIALMDRYVLNPKTPAGQHIRSVCQVTVDSSGKCEGVVVNMMKFTLKAGTLPPGPLVLGETENTPLTENKDVVRALEAKVPGLDLSKARVWLDVDEKPE